jgi:hypothetical protein
MAQVLSLLNTLHGCYKGEVMTTYDFYFKSGERQRFDIGRFVSNDETGQVELLDDRGTQFGFIVREHLSAIMEAELRPTERRDVYTFTIYLKEHLDAPIKVIANGWREPGFTFFLDNQPLRWLYLDSDQVVMVTYEHTN